MEVSRTKHQTSYNISGFENVQYLDICIPYLPVFEKKPGLAHVYEHVMFDGWKKQPKNKCEEIIEQNVCSINAYTHNTGMGICGYIKSNFLLVNELFQEILYEPNTTGFSLEKEKNVIIQEINEDDPTYKSFVKSIHKFRELMGIDKKLCCSVIGTEEDVNNITLDDLKELKESIRLITPRWFCINNRHIFFKEDEDNQNNYNPKIIYDSPIFEERLELDPQSEQTNIYFGWNMNKLAYSLGIDFTYASFDIISDYICNISNGYSLNNILREKGLIYGIDKIGFMVSGNFMPTFRITVSNKNAEDVVNEIKEYFEGFCLDKGVYDVVKNNKIMNGICSPNVLDSCMESIEEEKDGFFVDYKKYNNFIDKKYYESYDLIARNNFCTSNMCMLISK